MGAHYWYGYYAARLPCSSLCPLFLYFWFLIMMTTIGRTRQRGGCECEDGVIPFLALVNECQLHKPSEATKSRHFHSDCLLSDLERGRTSLAVLTDQGSSLLCRDWWRQGFRLLAVSRFHFLCYFGFGKFHRTFGIRSLGQGSLTIAASSRRLRARSISQCCNLSRKLRHEAAS